MKIIQCPDSKFLNILLISFFLTISCAFGQVSNHRLVVADSLFKAKQYTQSFEQYQSIFEQKQYSPAMLLKMAYIQEGLNNIGHAMYYLNLYFAASNDKAAITKMDQMAKKFNLQGYEETDGDHFLSYYHDYYFQITLFIVALSILSMALIFYTKIKLRRRPIASTVFLIVVLTGFFIHTNFGKNISEAVVLQQNTYVMSGPSAGAPVVEIINEGNRVEIIGKNDIWLKVRWREHDAYVKNSSLVKIEL